MNRFTSLIITLLLFSCINGYAQGKELYHRAQIFYEDVNDLHLLTTLGLEVDHGKHKKGVFVESDFSDTELNLAREAGFTVDIIIRDVVNYYVERNNKSKGSTYNKNLDCNGDDYSGYDTPENFELGSMGGFMTYEEILAELDQMVSLYPNLITVKAPISDFETIEGRSIFWVRMSDNPNIDEDEPEMMYNAIHHAREPASVSSLIFYMWYLLENYEAEDEIQSILNNSELYFVPVVNPDGYVFNQTEEPAGGGMWRKNRRVHDDGEYGVDNNRNYGYEWGTNGISFITESDIYCGEDPFSEAENQALKWFCENREFQIAFNNHSYSNLLLFPFGYEENAYTDDHAAFEIISEEMVSQNGFVNQTGSALYPASGVADDWMYIATPEKDRIFSFTPEIGSEDQNFWPVSSDIVPICNTTMFMNLTAAHLITKYASVADQEPELWNDLNGAVDFDLRRMGFQESDFSVSLTPITDNITFDADEVVFSGLDLFQTSAANMPYTLDPSIVNGESIQYQYVIDNGDYLAYSTVLTKTFGDESIVLADDASSTVEWNSSDWDTTTEDFVSSPSSITDSPNDEYANNENSTIALTEEINLTDVLYANLNFHAKWDIETGYDYVQVEVSTDGTNWTPQCGLYTSIGNDDQILDEPLYHGLQDEWVEESISLSDYIGEFIVIRFQLVSDAFVTEDGFYFDDLSVSIIDNSVGIEEININEAYVGQNIPNPANDFTTINYFLPTDMKTGEIVIQNNLGQEVERISITAHKTKTSIDLNAYAPGSYYYHLVSGAIETAANKLTVIE